MSISDKILVLENKIIDVLSVFTWWSEVNFNKSNRYWAFQMSILGPLFIAISFALDLPQLLHSKNYWLFGLFLIISLVEICDFLAKIIFQDILILVYNAKYPQGTPNPCRISRNHSFSRRFEFLSICTVLIFLKLDVPNLFFAFAFIFLTLKEFLFACDSIPPQEKDRRKSLNETFHKQLTLS